MVALKHIYSKELAYKRAGVMLLDLVETGHAKVSLFDTHDPRNEKPTEAFDAITDRFGLRSIQFSRVAQAGAWQTSSAFRSPNYTTRRAGIAAVKS